MRMPRHLRFFRKIMNLSEKICRLPVIAFIALCWLSFSTLAQNSQTTSRQPKSWAVVIGIAKYPKIPGGQQLMFADKDAAAFAEEIKKICGENIRVFINQDATVSAIKEAVGNWLPHSYGSPDA